MEEPVPDTFAATAKTLARCSGERRYPLLLDYVTAEQTT
jgi:hypothetical protein